MAGGGNAIRGSRVGAGPMGEAERGEAAPRQNVTFFCSNEHRTLIAFAVEAVVPETWDCPRCGLPASVDSENPPPGAEDRAVQDPPGLREGAPLRRRGEGHPQRGDPDPAPASQVRGRRLLARRQGTLVGRSTPTGDFWLRRTHGRPVGVMAGALWMTGATIRARRRHPLGRWIRLLARRRRQRLTSALPAPARQAFHRSSSARTGASRGRRCARLIARRLRPRLLHGRVRRDQAPGRHAAPGQRRWPW